MLCMHTNRDSFRLYVYVSCSVVVVVEGRLRLVATVIEGPICVHVYVYVRVYFEALNDCVSVYVCVYIPDK